MKHSKKLVTLSVLTTMSGAAIYFLNKTLDTAAVRKNLLASAEKESFFWQFGDIFYTKKGTGTPMLLLHDLHCASSGREWQYIEDALAQDHTVYTLDLLGCGRSDKPAITYTNFLYVQLIVTFIKQVIGCPTDVIASGLSGSFVVTQPLPETHDRAPARRNAAVPHAHRPIQHRAFIHRELLPQPVPPLAGGRRRIL